MLDATHDGIAISCYEGEVPDFADAELESLYQSLYASLAMFRIYNPEQPVNTYVARDGQGAVRALFLYRLESKRVVVCNEVMRVDAEEVERFASWIFSRYAGIDMVAFRAVECSLRRLPFPFQRNNVLEDVVLTLPARVEDYLGSLGKSTRRTVRGALNRIKRAYPSWRFEVSEGAAIREQDVLDIIRMNRARMSAKERVSAYDAAETRRICALVRRCGLVGTLTLDGRVCAGSVSFRAGDHYFMSISAHDPLYDEHRLGTLSSFLIIAECIRRGGRQCHLLWGRHEYKFRFLGELRELDNLTVYRSPLAMLRQAETVVGVISQGLLRGAHRGLQAARRGDSFAWRLMVQLAQGWRRLRSGRAADVVVLGDAPEQKH